MKAQLIINKLNIYLMRYHLIIFGFFLLIFYFWVRFLRSRLPREIPFTLSSYIFAVILFLCIFYAHQLFRLFKPRKSSWILELILPYVKIVAEAIVAFDCHIKNILYISETYENFISFLMKKMPVSFKYWDKRLFYLDFSIKILLSLTFALDILFFHRLYYFYKILFIGFLLLLPPYFIHCLRETREKLTCSIEEEIRVFILEYRQGVLPPKEDYFHPAYVEDEDDDDLGPPINMALAPRKFLDYHCNDLFYEEKLNSEKYHMYVHHKCLEKGTNFNEVSSISSKIHAETKKKISFIYEIFSVLETYNIIVIDSDFKTYYKVVSFITLNIYLISWIYILISSIKHLSVDEINDLFEIFSSKTEEPFSGQNENTFHNE